MRQVNVSLPDDLRAELDAASAAAGHTLATEIRNRLQRSIANDRLGGPNQRFMQLIGLLGFLTRQQTGHMWHEHAAAHFVFRGAIEILLGRMKPAGNPVLDPAELPADRPVAVTDLEAMAAGLEAIISHGRMLQEGEQLLLREWEEERRQQLDQFKKIFETPPPAPRSHMRKPKPEGGHE
jgi:hypothetical protein